MANEHGEFLVQAATYLAAAAVAVPIFNRFKLGSILGYLAAGVVAGPYALNLLHQEEGVFHIAEFGVVLFLFVIGLELSLPRLWALRRDIFGLGAAQIALTGAVLATIFLTARVMPMGAAAIGGLSLAFSSTAFALQYLKDRGELNTSYGARAFPILLMQDLMVVPLLAAIPFAAAGAVSLAEDFDVDKGWAALGRAVFVIAAIVYGGRFALNPLLRHVAGSGSREAFAATALLLVAVASLAVSWVGLPMGLGAFLAGVLLAESSYRHQIETDIEPFRGLLLGLFFILIGARLNLDVIVDQWMIVLGGAFGLVLVKAGLLYGLSRAFGARHEDALLTGAVLSQGGEFGFVVFSVGADVALFTADQATLLTAIVTISMVMTPFLMMAARRARRAEAQSMEGLETPPSGKGHVVIAGFGRVGQIISQVISAAGIDVIAIDKDPLHIRNAERFGFKVYYGDAARLDVLLTAGAFDARAVIFTMDDRNAVNHAVAALRQRVPNAFILVVAHDRLHEIVLQKFDPDVIVRETLESSLLLARRTLAKLEFSDEIIEDFIEQFRKRDRERLLAQMDAGPEAGREHIHQKFERVGGAS
ncbi:MAG: cation:proton antiporter [Parvularculaceae bacterium]|nr:cation:proton antiporter [Parvularculaceae bacterium]